jgi:cytochrome c553
MWTETANLILIPGRLCENGRPVPVEREDFRKFAQGLVEAGRAAYNAAQTKNQEKAIEVTNQVADACSACHEVYRDKGDAKSLAVCTP